MNFVDKRIFRDFHDIESLADLAEALERLLNSGCYVWDDGELVNAKQLVARENGLKNEIYSDEHAPPHFHVKSADINASFAIDDCSKIQGTMSRKDEDLVKYWHKMFKNKLIEVWNQTRPSDCPVGSMT